MLEVDNGRTSLIRSCTHQFWWLFLYPLHGATAVAVDSHCRRVSIQCLLAEGCLADALLKVCVRERRTWSVKKLFPSLLIMLLSLCEISSPWTDFLHQTTVI